MGYDWKIDARIFISIKCVGRDKVSEQKSKPSWAWLRGVKNKGTTWVLKVNTRGLRSNIGRGGIRRAKARDVAGKCEEKKRKKTEPGTTSQ